MSGTKVSGLIRRENVFTDIPAGDRDTVLRSVVERLALGGAFSDGNAATVYRAVLKRERIGSTGIGRGIGIPHCKTSAVEEPIVAFAKPLEAVEYGATDGAPVHSLFMVISPMKASVSHQEIVSWIAKIARSDYHARVLSTTWGADSLHQLFLEVDGVA